MLINNAKCRGRKHLVTNLVYTCITDNCICCILVFCSFSKSNNLFCYCCYSNNFLVSRTEYFKNITFYRPVNSYRLIISSTQTGVYWSIGSLWCSHDLWQACGGKGVCFKPFQAKWKLTQRLIYINYIWSFVAFNDHEHFIYIQLVTHKWHWKLIEVEIAGNAWELKFFFLVLL